MVEKVYYLEYNEETLKKYPFKFEIYISYEVHKDSVTTKYKVLNKDGELEEFKISE